MTKRRLAVLCMTAVLLLLSIGGLSVSAQTLSGYLGVTYELLSDGTICITGYTGEATSLYIPAEIDGHTVSAIGDSAFLRAFSLKTVSLPETVEVIGRSAFQETCLTQVYLPKNLKEIHENAFFCCDATYMELPSSVTYIGEQALGYRWYTPDPETGEWVVPGVPGVDPDFTIYAPTNDAVSAYAGDTGVAYVDLNTLPKGDADFDGTLSSNDARIILKHALSAEEIVSVFSRDADGNGAVNTADVRHILKTLTLA